MRALPIFALILTLGMLLAQEQSQSIESTDPLFRTAVSVVLAPTTVLDKDGHHVDGIQPHEFRLFDNEKLQDIRVDTSFAPIALVIAVQADAAAEPVLPTVRRVGPAIQGLITGDNGQAAVIAFDHRVDVKQDFTADYAKINEALEKIKPGSSSSRLLDTVLQSVRMLRNRPKNERRVLLLISETRDKASEASMREALLAAQLHDVTIYTANMSRLVTALAGKTPVPRPDPIPATARRLPGGAPQTPTAVAAYTGTGNVIPAFVEIFRGVKGVFVDNPSERLTEFTGGKEHSFKSQSDLEDVVRRIGLDLHSQYLISYNPNNKLEGGFHQIRVEVRRPDLNIRTRLGYWLAAVPH